MRNTMAAVIGSLVLAHNAMADERLDGLKKMNTDICMQIGAEAAGAPAEGKLTAPYCNCVTNAYWDSVPKSEVQQLMTDGQSPGIGANLKARMEAAKKMCKKKLEF